MKHLQSLRPLRAALCAVACGVALAVSPAAAWAEPTHFSPDNQLSTDVYNSLGLTTSELDETAAQETAPYDASSVGATSTVLTQNDTYMAANGSHANKYSLRSKLNRLDDAKPDFQGRCEDDYGWGTGGWDFWGLGKPRPEIWNIWYIGSNLSDNSHDVSKKPVDNGFDGIYATSEACDLGSGWDDCVVELRAYGRNSTTKIDRHEIHGAIAIKVMQLDANGNRTEVATLVPTTNTNQVYLYGPDARFKPLAGGVYTYDCAGYNQELDACFEVQVADVDNDGIDEIFSYSGAFVDRDGTRYALVDMFDRDGGSNRWNHTVTELDAGPTSTYATRQELREAALDSDMADGTEFIKEAPVVTLAGGNLDRKGGEEIAMAVSAPTDHKSPKNAAKCYIYTWDAESGSLCGIDGLNDTVQGPYIPLSSSNPPVGASSEAMVSANCTFGTFQVPGTQKTVDALLVAGWDCVNASNLSKNNKYGSAAYRYVYYDLDKDEFVVSDYDTKALGKDAAHIVDTATKEADQDDRYVPTLAPFALGCARLRGLRQSVENDQVLFGGEIYEFALGSGLSTSTGKSISMCSDQGTDDAGTEGYRKSKDQVWLGDVAVGNVSGSDNYEESFLAVVGVHGDDDVNHSDCYWMDVAHFTAKYQGNPDGRDNENASAYAYVTAQEQVVLQGVERKETQPAYGTWISLCLPNVRHRGVQVKYQDMAKYYTAPQVLAMLEDAPYFQDLQDSFRYIVMGGTGFERSEGTGKGSGWGIEGQVGVWGSMSGGFLGRIEIEGELSAHGSYESQNMSTLEYGVSYSSYAGEGNKVVVYTVPLVYYHYQISDPDHPGTWQDVIIPEYLEPTTALVSADVWDQVAPKVGAPMTGEVLQNTSGDPSTYTSAAMAAGGSNQKYGLSVTRAFTSKENATATSSQGGMVVQGIDTSSESEQTIGYGGGIALKAGGGFGVGASAAMAGIAFDASGGFSNLTSSSRGFGFSGTVDNLPEQAKDYQFTWKLAVNKSHKDMAQNGEKPSDNQFWIVGYEVSDYHVPDVRAISGFTTTGATDHSVMFTWDDVLPAGGAHNYGIAMLDGNDSIIGWRVVPAGTTSYEWELHDGVSGGKFTIAGVTGDNEKNVKLVGIRSPIVSANKLPPGYTLAMEGADIRDPKGADKPEVGYAERSVGDSLVLEVSALLTKPNAEGDGSIPVEPKFIWYRRAKGQTGEGEALGHGDDVVYASEAGTLSPSTSTLTISKVEMKDEGSEYYCKVIYDSVGSYDSRPVSLHVTHTVTNAGEGDFASGRHARLRSLSAGRRSAFYRVYPDAQVTLVEGSSDRNDDPDGNDDSASKADGTAEPAPTAPTSGSGSRAGGNAGARSSSGESGGNGTASNNDSGADSSRTSYAASAGGLAQTGDTMVSGAVICTTAAVAAALISIGWHMRRHHR